MPLAEGFPNRNNIFIFIFMYSRYNNDMHLTKTTAINSTSRDYRPVHHMCNNIVFSRKIASSYTRLC